MKLFHAADLHIGDSRSLPGYLERQSTMMTNLTNLCVEHQPQVAIYAGDIFDSKYVLPRERDLFLDWLLRNDEAGQKHNWWTVLINGNHDQVDANYTHLTGAELLMRAKRLHRTIVVNQKPRVIEIPTDQPTKLFCCAVPCGNYRKDELSNLVSSLYANTKLKAEQSGCGDFYFVVAAHEGISGAVNEAGTYRVTKGPTLDPDIPVTYWALGDIHKPFQQILPNAWYSGSPIQHDFGDLSADRGALLVDLDNPTKPQPLLLKGVRRLLTLYDMPDEWPSDDDAIIRYEGTASEIATGQFPDNVVLFKPVDGGVEVDDATYDQSDDLLAGLGEVLSDHVPSELHVEVTEEIERACAAL